MLRYRYRRWRGAERVGASPESRAGAAAVPAQAPAAPRCPCPQPSVSHSPSLLSRGGKQEYSHAAGARSTGKGLASAGRAAPEPRTCLCHPLSKCHLFLEATEGLAAPVRRAIVPGMGPFLQLNGFSSKSVQSLCIILVKYKSCSPRVASYIGISYISKIHFL